MILMIMRTQGDSNNLDNPTDPTNPTNLEELENITILTRRKICIIQKLALTKRGKQLKILYCPGVFYQRLLRCALYSRRSPV